MPPPAEAKQRRSRMERLLDILEAVAEGTQKPTRVMQTANLTWSDLLEFTEGLMRSGLLVREPDTKEFSLTAKGRAALGQYAALKEALSQASPPPKQRVTELLRRPLDPHRNALVATALQKRLEDQGYVPLPREARGKSGAKHEFDVVVKGREGSKRGYVVLGDVSESKVVALFARQLDTDITSSAVFTGKASPGARMLAESYGLRLEKWVEEKQPRGGRQDSRLAALPGAKVLLEVDPTSRFEDSVREAVAEFAVGGMAACVFTWKASPVYEAVQGARGLRLYTMTSAVSYTTRVGSTDEYLVPQDDRAILLDEMRKAAESHSGIRLLVVFDSISDLMVRAGLANAYDFVVKMNEVLTAPNVTVLSLVKRGTLDPSSDNLIKGVFSHHLRYDESGLKVTR